ncbi:MAG TPA: hypothetical protein VK633_13805 [Verrucomicrobiae bacterium]|nr:hypothetical protein [Verrucomicrobiae bacterium]
MNDFMQTLPKPEPSIDYSDPRLAEDFQACCWPSCNGGSAPPVGTLDLQERRCLEFLTAYYHLNCANRAITDLRNETVSSVHLQSRRFNFAAALQALENLEDRYAPIGFYGEPVMTEEAFYKDIHFVRPELRHPGGTPLVGPFLAIPGLDQIPSSELQGDAAIYRWSHEEAHS